MNIWIEFVFYCGILILGAFIVSWATESAQVLISQGLALTILAWVQMLPEFAVESGLAYSAAKNVENAKIIGANFTGSIRFLIGFAIPLIFLVRIVIGGQFKEILQSYIILPRFYGISALTNFLPTLLFTIVLFKRTISIFDSMVLILLYIVYVWYLRRIPPVREDLEEKMEFVPYAISQIKYMFLRRIVVMVLFLTSAVIFYKVVEPFVESCKRIATAFLISEFIFIQWIAPVLTEFPEGLTIFYWAKDSKKAPIGLLNLLSANIGQWTILPAMIPLVYFLGGGKTSYVSLSIMQLTEIALTASVTVFLTTMLLNRKITFLDASILFSLWLSQFLIPVLRTHLIFVYLALSLIKIINLIVRKRTSQLMVDIIILAKR